MNFTFPNFATLLQNDTFLTPLKIVLALYAAQIAPNAPSYITTLFKNVYIKILLIFLMMYSMKYDFQLSLILAIIFVLGMNVASGRGALESYSNMYDSYSPYNKNYKPVGNFTLLDSRNEIYPGCEKITLADLVHLFDHNYLKLQTSVQHAFYMLLNDPAYHDLEAKERLYKIAIMAGLPYNMELNDDNAPWIASLLVNYNFIVTDTCQPPGYSKHTSQ